MKKPGIEIPSIEVVAVELETPNLSGDALLARIESLKGRYDEPWRKHHNFQHPLELFAELIRFKDEVNDPNSVGWTIMYHDAIYDPQAETGRNEELSALLAEAETPLFLAVSGVNKVASYTRASAKHSLEQPDKDLEFFLDADLAILGAPPARYDIYSEAIKEEYSHVPPDLYIPGRVNILRDLATRFEGDAVYTTEVFRAKYEEQAQANIAREIEMLNSAVREETST